MNMMFSHIFKIFELFMLTFFFWEEHRARDSFVITEQSKKKKGIGKNYYEIPLIVL